MANEFNIKNGFKSNGDSTVSGKLTTQKLTITSGATNGYVLTSDASGNATWNAPVTNSGKFGIADSNGAYTYYATLTLAMSAATAGQTIELFTDYTESGSVTITLKNGVNINGNGHTYNYTNATGNCFIDNGVAVTCVIQNLIVNRTAHTSGSVWVLSSASTNIDFIGSKTYMTSASASDYIASLACAVRNLWVKGTGTSIRGIYGGVLSSCYAEVTGGGYAIVQLYPNATDCTGISVSGRGFYVYEDGVLIRCYGKSTSDYGMFCETSASNILLYNCIVLSSSGVALYLRGCKVYNTICISSSNTAIFCAFSNNQLFNCSARSASGVAIGGQSGDIINNSSAISDGNYTVGGITIRNSSIINNWNNASGHAYSTPSASSEIANNYMSVTNASANCLYNASGVSVKYANNAFKGATTPVNANITQAIINTQDNQGNILL